jgi:O-antigen biosynthesis protein
MKIDGFKTRLVFALAEARARLSGSIAPIGLRVLNKRGDRWEAVGRDPQLIFRAPPSGASVFSFVLDARPQFIQPELFFDWGDGFHSLDKISVGSAQLVIVRVRLGDASGLRKIRLDPADGICAFDFRCAICLGAKEPEEEEASLLEEAREQGSLAILKEIDLMDFAPAKPGRPAGLKTSPRDANQHFLRIVEMARREFSAESHAPADETSAAPLISFVVPVYNTSASYLDDLVKSFRQQKPGIAELVLSDDGSTSEVTRSWLEARAEEPGVVVRRCAKNGGIAAALNAGIQVSRGEWVGFVDHDDALAPYAVLALARAIRENPEAKFIYTDELIADKDLRGVDYFLKPAFDDVLLSGVNYINHLSLYKRQRVIEIGCFRSEFDGSQDYDLLLRYLSKIEPSEIRHLPYPSYIWRRDGASYSVKHLQRSTANARRSLSEAYSDTRKVVPAEAAIAPDLHRLRFDAVMETFPALSIVIPNRNSFPLIRRVLDGLVDKTDYPLFEIIVIDNGTTDPDVLRLYDRMRNRFQNFKAVIQDATYSFSWHVNRGIELSAGELILLLNNDVEIIDADWLREMVACFKYPRTGIVGARLLYPDRTLQHAGVIVGLGDFAGHWFVNQPADSPGPMGRLLVRSSMTAVTAACMMISRECVDRTGLFDEQNFAVAYNDVDFCLRAREAGFRTIYTPFAKLLHHESATRGRDDRGSNRPRFLREQAELLERHGTELFEDPAYSPWYARDHSVPHMIALDALPKAR